MSLFFLFVLFCHIIFYLELYVFSLLSGSLFSAYCPTILEQTRNNKNNKRPKTSEHWQFGIPLSLPMVFETIILLVLFHFFFFWLCFFDVCFVCFWFHVSC